MDNFIVLLVLYRHAVEKQVVKSFVTDYQIRALRMGDTQYHLIQHGNREMWVNLLQLLQ